MTKSKTKIAIFDLTGCEGCEFHLMSLDEKLLDLFQDFEITHWRLLSEKYKGDFDVAFIEGAVTTKEHINLLKKIRETSKIVVAIGACAVTGNIFAELTPENRKKLATKIYDKNYKLKAEFLEPVEKFIKVDKKVPGCPPNIEIFNQIIEELRKKRVTSKKKQVTSLDYTAKIEGHGTLKVNLKKKEVFFDVEESERLIEGLLLNKDFKQAPFFTSRICGICPIAHNTCSLSAIEDALRIKLSEEAITLRRMLLSAQVIKSHLLHLFFLVLPDYAKVKDSLELSQKYPAEFHLMLNIKRIADDILEAVAGSAAFPLNTTIGGFRSPPQKEKLLTVKESIFDVIDEAQDLVKIFSSLDIPDLKVETKFSTITPIKSSYPLYPGTFSQLIEESLKENSTAKIGLLKGGEVIKTGALARLTHFSNNLNPKAKKAFKESNLDFNNPFNNNSAQAVEILHFLEEVIELIDELKDKDLSKSKGIKEILPSTTVFGKACLEAPRGTLFHQIEINPQAKIVNYNIVPPTQINLASLEKEAQALVEQFKGSSTKKIKEEIEKLIRSFDPCITCAVH